MPTLHKTVAIIWGVLALSLAGCAKSPPAATTPAPAAAPTAADTWPGLRDGFIEDTFKAQPLFAAQNGRHEFDGQMPDLSGEGIEREIARLHAARERIAAADAAALKPDQAFEREHVLSVIDDQLFWLQKARFPFRNPSWYIGEIDPDVYLSRNYAPLDVRMKAYIGYARAIPKIAADIDANLQAPLPKSYLDIGIEGFGGFADFFKHDVGAIFAAVKDPDLQQQLVEANMAASAAMLKLKNRLVAERKTAADDFALGKDLFAEMVRDTDSVDVPIEQIEAAGRADLARNTAALTAECAVYLPNGTIKNCIAKMSANKPAGNLLDAARAQLGLLKRFVVEHHVVGIPSDEEALVALAPPYNRSNFAFIQVPGPYDKGVASTFNIAPPDPKWSKAVQAAYLPGNAFLTFTAAHEVWPGHFLQFLHSNSNPSKLAGLWVGYAFSEGWAHYCEEMMIEEGYGKGDPELHVGQLVQALMRDVRLLSAIGLHTHGMTVAQSEQMFREQAYLDRGNSRQQAARGTYDPAYLNYTLGKLMIRKLRADWVAKTLAAAPAGATSGARSGVTAVTAPPAPVDLQALWHDFHDKFLSYGGPPIPLVRKQMLGKVGAVL
jgi:Bacterial protein of unknown function (DUF885)